MKKIGSILLSIVFAICLLLTLLLGIVREKLNIGTLMDVTADMLRPVAVLDCPNTGLYYPDYVKKISTVQYAQSTSPLGELDLSQIDWSNMDLNQVVTDALQESGLDIDADFIADVLEDKESQKFLNKYFTQITEYMIGKRTDLEIETKDVKDLVNNAFDKYEAATGQVIDRTYFNETVEDSIEEVESAIKQGIDQSTESSIDEETKKLMQEGFDYLEKITDIKTLIICIAICMVFAVLIFLINKNFFGMCKYISIPGIIDGILILSLGLVLYSTLPGIVEQSL